MKNLKFIILILSITFLSVACDKVANPVIKSTTTVGSNFIIKTNDDISNYKKMILEDYTGQRCVNCPEATRIIKTLLKAYGDTLIAIAVHQGGDDSFAAPLGKNWPNDFRTDAGQEWGSKSNSIGFAIDQYPTGLINRKKYQSSGPRFSRATWTGICAEAKKDPFILKLNLKTEYDPSKRALNTYVKGTFLANYPNPVKVVAAYMQDSIIGKQEDNGVVIPDYEFEHMLRGDLSGPWGVNLTTSASIKDNVFDVSFLNKALPDSTRYEKYAKGAFTKVNDKKITVVTFAYDANTLEILQAEKVKIR